jgi:1-aminocyclopropane-1-carboxylate deaminase/D-cysteine desulfhydrase-like pyridoxal-dependent ACC family enzyme
MTDVLSRSTAATLWSRAELAACLAKQPRIPLAALPTPLEEMPRFSEALGGPRVLVKRDDLTGLALGGNKVRHLEFRLADALAQGCDCFVALNVAQSNHARLHAAVAARFGLKMYHLRPGPLDAPVEGNLLLDHLFGSEIIPLGEIAPEEREARLTGFLDELAARGERPYPVIHRTNPRSAYMGVLAYLNAGIELLNQVEARRIDLDHIFVVGGCSAAGLALAGKLLGASYRVHAVCVGEGRAALWRYVQEVAAGGAAIAGLPITLDEDDLDIHDEYVGPAYGKVTEAGIEAIRLAARTEALVLDPVYTGKAMSGLIGEARAGRVQPHETALLVHTGGLPITFAYHDEILARL